MDYVEIAGIKWATCNVGAEKPTDAGLYFQWGDRKGYTSDEVGNIKGGVDWKHYKHHNGNRFTKYNEFDGKHILDLCDDAAFTYMGQGWRMPTKEDFRCLVISTTHRWTCNYQDSGAAGIVFTDITDNSKELFLPAAGYRYAGVVYGVGNCGYYWSSSLFSGNIINAYHLVLDIRIVSWGYGSYRYCGYPVRGILTV